MRKLILALVLISLTTTGCDPNEESKSGTRPTEVAGETIPPEKEVRDIAKTAGPEDCNTYFKQVVETCHQAMYDGLKISCSTLVMKAKVAKDQKSGDLFSDPNGKVSASTIGDANCAVNIKSLARKIKKAEMEPKIAWGIDCKGFLEKLDDKCIAPIAKGEFGESCTAALMQIRSLKGNDKREELCKNLGGIL